MMVDGKVLCAVSRLMFQNPSPPYQPLWPVGVNFQEYDPLANSFTAVSSPTGAPDPIPSWQALMLILPDGNVLYSDFSSQLYVYAPSGSPLPAGKPTINSITANIAGISYHLTGTKLNGISEGASYGDDAQMNSNYPLVRMTNSASGNVYYARTYNWSSTGVMTGNTPVTTEFDLPAAVWPHPGVYSLVVVANGNSSDPVAFTVPAGTWVDFNYHGGGQNGSYATPFGTLAQGVSAVPTGQTILIKATGTSSETMTITKPMTIIAVGGSATIGQ